MQMCRFPTSLGNATGCLDREIKQSRRDACGKVAIKYSLTTIQTLSRATSGQVKKLNRDFLRKTSPGLIYLQNKRAPLTGLAEQCTLPGGKRAHVNGTRDKVCLPTEWRRFDVRGVGKHNTTREKAQHVAF